MSRIGKLPVILPEGVSVKTDPGYIEVNGPKGSLKSPLHKDIRLEIIGNTVKVFIQDELKSNIHGLTRSLIANMVRGVAEEWKKTLELAGTGFRSSTDGGELQLALGFSHPVIVKAPEGIKFEVKENKITVLGANKTLVGEVAAKIRRLKPADPYKLKGFKYENEVIIKKAGKAAKAGV